MENFLYKTEGTCTSVKIKLSICKDWNCEFIINHLYSREIIDASFENTGIFLSGSIDIYYSTYLALKIYDAVCTSKRKCCRQTGKKSLAIIQAWEVLQFSNIKTTSCLMTQGKWEVGGKDVWRIQDLMFLNLSS